MSYDRMVSAPITPVQQNARQRFRGHYTLPLAIWTLWLAYATLSPPSSLPHVEFAFSDKIAHVTMFAIWSALWIRAWVRDGAFTFRAGLLALLTGSAWGYYLEILQSFTDYRAFDLFDFAADAFGVLIGILAFILWRRKFGAHS